MAAERTCKVRPDVIARTLTTMQEQLGLKAEAGKAMLEMLVIESAEKPSEKSR
jgi:uncharacterized protein (TIGR03435 family)